MNELLDYIRHNYKAIATLAVAAVSVHALVYVVLRLAVKKLNQFMDAMDEYDKIDNIKNIKMPNDYFTTTVDGAAGWEQCYNTELQNSDFSESDYHADETDFVEDENDKL